MIPVLLAAAAAGYGYATQVRAGEHEVTVASAPSPLLCGETTLSAHEIYWRLRGGPGVTSLVRADAAAELLADRYDRRMEQVRRLRDRMARAWQGNAADGGQDHLAPLATALRQSRDLLASTVRPLRAQAESFQHAYDRVEEVPPEPPSSSLLNDVNPFRTDTDRQIDEYNTKASNNVRIYTEYNTASHDNSTAMPRNYPALPTTVAPVVVRSSTAQQPGTATPGFRAGGPAASSHTPGVSGSSSAPITGLPPSGGTTAQDWTPAARSPAPVTAGPSGGPAVAPQANVPVSSGPVIDVRPGTPGTPGRPDAGAGPRPGGGPPVRGPAPTAQAAAPGGRGGPGGVSPVGVGRRQDGDDDREHNNRYTAEPDKEEMFGPDEPYFPPVIGAKP